MEQLDDKLVPPVARDLPAGLLESAVAGASQLDAGHGGSLYGRNLIGHALVQLRRDGWLAEDPQRVGPALLNLVQAVDHFLGAEQNDVPWQYLVDCRRRLDDAAGEAWLLLRPQGRPKPWTPDPGASP